MAKTVIISIHVRVEGLVNDLVNDFVNDFVKFDEISRCGEISHFDDLVNNFVNDFIKYDEIGHFDKIVKKTRLRRIDEPNRVKI